MWFGMRMAAVAAVMGCMCAVGAASAAADTLVANPGTFLLQAGSSALTLNSHPLGQIQSITGAVGPDGHVVTDTVNWPEIDIPDNVDSVGTWDFSYSDQVLQYHSLAGSGSIDPATGSVGIELPSYASFSASVHGDNSVIHTGFDDTFTCMMGAADTTFPIDLSSTGSLTPPALFSGSVAAAPYDAATGAITLVSNLFTPVDLFCNSGSILDGSLANTIVDYFRGVVDGAAGTNSVWMQGTFTPAFKAPAPPAPPSAAGDGGTGSGIGPGTGTGTGAAPVMCHVPKLTGLSLSGARKKLTKAHCKLGKVRHAHSKKVRKGRVISERSKVGKILTGDSAVGITVSSGRPPKHKHGHH